MDKNFWIQKWEKKEIGFHQKDINPHLKTHFEKLSLHQGQRIFVPLCGKTLDIAWLLSNGYRVVGAELAEKAIEELFLELKIKPQISHKNKLTQFSAQNIDIFVGDIFDLTKEDLGEVDAVYDRAALVALPEEIRKKYTQHLLHLTHKAPQLLVVYEYPQKEMEGPPFSISSQELTQHYSSTYTMDNLASASVAMGIKKQITVNEKVWLLKTKQKVS